MDSIFYNPLLQVTEENIKTVNKFYGIEDKKRIEESLDSVEDWIKKQDHLVEASKYISRRYLTTFFILSKGSQENMKKKIDKILTLRALIPELSQNKTPSEFEHLFESVKFVPLPKLFSKDTTRVLVTQLVPDNIEKFSLLSFLRYCHMVSEYRLHYDYSLGDRYILDMNQVSIVSKLNPILIKKTDVISDAYGNKIKGIHILNAPPYIDVFVSLLKQTIREKVASRLHIHKSYEELYQHIDREILPEDFGGDEESIEKLCEQWKDHLKTEDALKLVSESNKIISDENKRNSSQFNEEYMGMPGSFRQLNVD